MGQTTQTVKLTIDSKTIIRIMAVGFAFVVGLEILGVVDNILKLLAMAVFLAVALNPLVNSLTTKVTKGRRSLAVGLAYLMMITVLTLFFVVVIPPFAKETSNFIDNLPNYVDEIRQGEGFVSNLVRDLRLDEQLADFSENVSDYVGPANQALLSGLGAIGTFIFSLLTVLVLSFFVLLEAPTWLKHFWEAQTKQVRNRYQPLLRRIYGVVTGYVNGQLLIASIAAVTSFIAIMLAGVPYALPLAAIVGLFGLIPLIGATLGSAVVILIALFTSVYSALFMLIFFIVYQQIENNVIQPFIQARNLDVSPLIVLVAVLFGAVLGGLFGALVAIPVAATIKIIYFDYHGRKVAQNKKA